MTPVRGRQKSLRCGRGGHTLVERSPTPLTSRFFLSFQASPDATPSAEGNLGFPSG
jgi:hypothetical protein